MDKVATVKKLQILVLSLFLAACSQLRLQSSGVGINSFPALWKVVAGNSTMYLFGSIHSLPPKVKWYSLKIKQAFYRADELVLENVPGSTNQQTFSVIERKFGYLPRGKIIGNYLTKHEYAKFKRIVRGLGLDEYKASRMQPWFFSMVVNSLFGKKKINYGVDQLLYDAARRKGMKVSGLETSYQQIKSLAAEPLSIQIKNLKQTLNARATGSRRIRKDGDLLASWMSGNTAKTAKIVSDSTSNLMYDSLIVKRNSLWYPKIKAYLSKRQTTMVVVGQAHLIGRSSIISKLKNSGYKVHRLQ